MTIQNRVFVQYQALSLTNIPGFSKKSLQNRSFVQYLHFREIKINIPIGTPALNSLKL